MFLNSFLFENSSKMSVKYTGNVNVIYEGNRSLMNAYLSYKEREHWRREGGISLEILHIEGLLDKLEKLLRYPINL